jgi:hypothetical protein
MSSVNATDIATLLERWSEAKAEMAELEKKVEKYKRLANRVMEQHGNYELSSSYYTLKKRKISRKTISKQDVPKDVWETYARSTSYPAYYLTENK